MKRILVMESAQSLLVSACIAGVSANPEREISKLLNAIMSPQEPPPIPKFVGPNPKKRDRGPWDRGFRKDVRR